MIQASVKSDGNPTQPLLQAGLTNQLSDRGKDYKPREEFALPGRCGVCTHKLILIQSHPSYALTLFRIPLHRTESAAIALEGDGFCQLSDCSTEAAAKGRRPPSPRCKNMGSSGSAGNASTEVFGDQENLP